MRKLLYTTIAVFLFCSLIGQQPPDTTAHILQQDSILKPLVQINIDTLIYTSHPYMKFTKPARLIAPKRAWSGKEHYFYVSVALLLFFAVIRNGFGKYLQDLFRLFFRTTLKQRQVKEQLMQATLPSLLLNLLFLLSGGMFICLLFQHYQLGQAYNFWTILSFGAAALAVIYIVKFFTLKLCGWLFRLSVATDAYSFIVFTTNKIIGIVILPFIVLLAFTNGSFQQAMILVSLGTVGLIFIYRYYLSYSTIRNQIRINFFHFLLYLFAFEIIPLLLINKVLVRFLGESY